MASNKRVYTDGELRHIATTSMREKTLPEFDVMAELAQRLPDVLEEIRLSLSEDTITQASEGNQRKLRGLQFKIDMQCRRAKNPLAATIKLSQMMHESFSALRDQLNTLQHNPLNDRLRKHIGKKKDDTSSSADILDLFDNKNDSEQ